MPNMCWIERQTLALFGFVDDGSQAAAAAFSLVARTDHCVLQKVWDLVPTIVDDVNGPLAYSRISSRAKNYPSCIITSFVNGIP